MQKNYPTRKNNRLEGYDYSTAGYYFITICIKDRTELLGSIDTRPAIGYLPAIQLSEIGKTVETAMLQIEKKYETVTLLKHTIMPNHLHMIIALNHTIPDGRTMAAPTISTIVNQFKGYATRQVGFPIWQKLFHDHIIRNHEEYLQIWQYIDENPAKWTEDRYYVEM